MLGKPNNRTDKSMRELAVKESALMTVLEPIVHEHGMEIDALKVVRAGKRSVLRITLDGDGASGHGLTIDDIADATRAISAALDDSDVTGNAPYTLEVGTRGVSAPLTRPAHWRRNITRLVAITPVEGEKYTGRITAADEEGADLDIDGESRHIEYQQVRKAVVQVEMNRKDQED